MTTVITLASAKGGSGKTTIAASIANVLAQMGQKCLLVDCDEATNGLTLLYIDEVNSFPAREATTKAQCGGSLDLDNSIIPSFVRISKNIDLWPAAFIFDRRKELDAKLFYEHLHATKNLFFNEYDTVILDAQAGSEDLSFVAMDKTISDFVVIVSEYDPMSAAGVERLKGLSPDNLSYDRTWILLNKLLPEFVEKFSEFLSVSHYLPPLPWTAEVVRAYSRRQLALNFDKGSEYTMAMLQLIRSLPIDGMDKMVELWLENKAETLKQPIEVQIGDTYDIVRSLNREIDLTKRRSSKIRLLITSASIAISAAALWLSYLSANKGESLLAIGEDRAYTALVTLIIVLAMAPLIASIISSNGLVRLIKKMLGLPVYGGDQRTEIDILEAQLSAHLERLRELEFLKSASATELLSGNVRRGKRDSH